MSNINKLLQTYCSNGVEYKQLSEVAKIERGVRITKKDLIEDGKYPVMSGGTSPMGYINDNNRDKNTITISSYGAAGYIDFQTQDFWANDVCLCVYPVDIDNKYLYYALKNQQEYIYANTTKAIPDHIPTQFLLSLELPVPPLEVQREIVEILDKFTLLTAELTAELTARKEQFETYRNRLLINQGKETLLGDECETITDYVAAGSFKDIANNVSYRNEIDYAQLIRTTDIKNKFSKSDFVYVDEKAYNYLWRVCLDKEEAIILPNIGVNCGEVYYVEPKMFKHNKNCLGPNAILVRSSHNNNKYLKYYFETPFFQKQLSKIISPAGQTKFNKTELKKIELCLPSLEEQQRIVDILDRFDTLCNDISSGLPAEIEARQKQYEYYRDKLLTFKRLEN